jgi:predicted double-glycine peptidase
VASVCLALAAPDVPFVHQIREGCGSAAVAMVMQYWVRQTPGLDAAASAAEHIDRALRPKSGGLSGDALRGYFEANGFSAYVFNGEIGDLRDHTSKGRPVIACLGPAARGELHFVVVAGVDAGRVIINDPARGKNIAQPLPGFLREWKASGDWALLAVPRRRP